MIPLFFLFLVCGCSSSRQENPPPLISIHIIDREGLTQSISTPERLKGFEQVNFSEPQPYQKVMRVYAKDDKGICCSQITTYHPNGQLKQSLDVVNQRAFGCYKEWHTNGILKVEGTIIEGIADISTAAEKSWLFDGLCTAWDERGQKLAEIFYQRGTLEGPSYYYHPNGAIWKTMHYQAGLLEGTLSIYLEDGSLLQESTCHKGVNHGYSLRYWPSGQKAWEETYEKGRLLCGEYWDIQGNKIASIQEGCGWRALFTKEGVSELREYRAGKQEGCVKLFDMRGAMLSTHCIKNGLKEGEELYFYPQGTPKFSVTWRAGKIQGIAKSWYENGTLESQREMSANTKNGVCTAWYENGFLMLAEEYDQGRLKRGDYFRLGEKSPVSRVSNGEGTASIFDKKGVYLRTIRYHNGLPEL